MRLISILIFSLIVFAGLIILQIFLSKRDNKWVGLILPIITFLFSLVIVLSVALDNYYGLPVLPIAFTFFIPPVVLLTIYVACRGKHNERRALEKMSVQGLE